MDGARQDLPASLSVATPPTQRSVKRATSSLTLDSGLRSWAHGRYSNRSQVDLVLPGKAPSSKSPATQWLAWSKDAVLPTASSDAAHSHRSSRSDNEPIELPAFDSRPSSRNGVQQSGLAVSPLSAHRHSMDADLLVLRRESIRSLARVEPLRPRRNSHAPTQPSNNRNDLEIMTSESAAPRPSPIRASFPVTVRSRPVSNVAMVSVTRFDSNSVIHTEPEPFVSPVDIALFATATGSLDFGFPATPPSPVQQPPTLRTISSPQPNISSNHSSALLQPLRPSRSHRSRSMPPRRTSQRDAARNTGGSFDGQMAAVVREPSHALLMLESLGLNDPALHDDELPDYETSQAEAHAARREQASRRARELEQRWQQSWIRGRMH